jgi:hypothetical protein
MVEIFLPLALVIVIVFVGTHDLAGFFLQEKET